MVTEEPARGLDAPLTREDLIDLVRAVRDETRAMIDALRTELTAQVGAYADAQDEAKMAALSKRLRADFGQMVEKAVEGAANRFAITVKSLPVPQISVHVPEQKALPTPQVN
ncbi:MAG TPA: hypothetical protein VEA41_06460, partial [Salinarimonas sp.]|nr:hypothetical protein [Salinarimonas sp.]